MTISRILTVLTVSLTLIALAGCQEQQADNNSQPQQLADCQQENAELQAKIETQQAELEKLKESKEGMSAVLTELIIEMDKLKSENTKLKKSSKINSQAPTNAPKKNNKNIQQGLQELFELRKKSAEKMKQDAQK